MKFIEIINKINFPIENLFYTYKEGGGTQHASYELSVNENNIIKTIIFAEGHKHENYIAALMHGNEKISTRKLEKLSQISHLQIASPNEVFHKTGYKVGSISPFWLSEDIPIFVHHEILLLSYVISNGGEHGTVYKFAPTCFNFLPCNIGDIKK